jgi:GTP-binding protein Era
LISALLIVERAGQKGVLIGRGGRMLGELRTCALAKLAEITDKPVELKFWIKVMPGWRRKRRQVRELSLIDGY